MNENLPAKPNTLRTFTRLLSYALTDRRLVRTAVILLLIATAADVCSPLLIKIFIDDHLLLGDWSTTPLDFTRWRLRRPAIDQRANQLRPGNALHRPRR